MFESNKVAAWTQNAPHLSDCLSFVGNAAKRNRAYNAIEALIREGQRLRVSADQLDLSTQTLCALAGNLQHSGTDFDSRDLHIGWIERQVAPCANGNLQHLPTRLGTGPGPAITKKDFFAECYCFVIFGG